MLLDIGLSTPQRWRGVFAGDEGVLDLHKGSHSQVSVRLSADERQRILLTCNKPGFSALQPGQNVPVLADRGLYIGSQSRFYRVLNAHGQAHRRARPSQKPSPDPRPQTQKPNKVWR